MNKRHHILRGETGLTLIELLVSMMLLAVVTSAVLAGALAVYRSSRFSENDSDSLAVLRTATTRLTDELREAHQIDASSTARRIKFWVDTDRDGVPEAAEWVSWELVAVASEAHFTRTTDASSASRVVARDLVYADAFAYNASSPEDASLVTVTLAADTRPGELSPVRTIHTKVRLRNAPSS